MNTLGALALIAIGLRIGLWARFSSAAWPYRVLKARAAVLWGERADRFLLVSGSLIAALGLAGVIGVW